MQKTQNLTACAATWPTLVKMHSLTSVLKIQIWECWVQVSHFSLSCFNILLDTCSVSPSFTSCQLHSQSTQQYLILKLKVLILKVKLLCGHMEPSYMPQMKLILISLQDRNTSTFMLHFSWLLLYSHSSISFS